MVSKAWIPTDHEVAAILRRRLSPPAAGSAVLGEVCTRHLAVSTLLSSCMYTLAAPYKWRVNSLPM